MSDTISAAQFWSTVPVQMDFLAPATVAPASESGGLHVAGGLYDSGSSGGLVVEFTNASPEFPNWQPTADWPTNPPTISGYAGHGMQEQKPVIVGALHSI